jgi:hypothetical protein
MESISGSQESGPHWSRVRIRNHLVRLDAIAEHAGALPNFRAELASSMRHRGRQGGPSDAQSAW